MSELLQKHDFSFQKKYGQNFLRDVKIPRRIASECVDTKRAGYSEPGQDLTAGSDTVSGKASDTVFSAVSATGSGIVSASVSETYEPVVPGSGTASGKIRALMLEIGPGAGILTKELAARFERVVAVEIDESLRPVLDESLKECENTSVVFGDIMETDLHSLLDPLRIAPDGTKLPVSVCANLPYYITTPILMKLIEQYDDFDFITVMVQKEVAARLTSVPGKAEYGSITASINLHSSVKRLFSVPSGCFFPRPKVDSAVIRLELFKPSKYTERQISGAGKLIKAAFAMRRKTLVNALEGILPDLNKAEITRIITKVFGDGSQNVRGETLSADDFVKLSEAIYGEGR